MESLSKTNFLVQHEAGHFLIAYLLGILPKGYTLTSLDAFKKEGSLNVQAGTAFVDIEFVEEVMLFLISNAQVFYNHVRPASVIAFCAY